MTEDTGDAAHADCDMVTDAAHADCDAAHADWDMVTDAPPPDVAAAPACQQHTVRKPRKSWIRRTCNVAAAGAAMAFCANSEKYRLVAVMACMYAMTRQAGGSHMLAFQVAMAAARVLLYSSPAFQIARQFLW